MYDDNDDDNDVDDDIKPTILPPPPHDTCVVVGCIPTL